ncbi:MAG: glycosyltransferase 87 family protein, partial [Candidatus Bathyarchaeia archaeon]
LKYKSKSQLLWVDELENMRCMKWKLKPHSCLKHKFEDFLKEDVLFIYAWLGYSVILAIVYWWLPASFESNWLYFFTYLFENGALPYIDSRVGYPPLGFLIYLPLAKLSSGNLKTFMYSFRFLNAIFLLISQLLIYKIVKRIHGKRDALIAALTLFSLPSMALLSRFSNDVLSLFTTLLALYFLIERRIEAAGISIGIAAMVKGIPGLLILPALAWLRRFDERYKLFTSAAITVFVISLPFLIADPFMYISVYTHHGDRGPWETIWALVDGWLSHGGFIHPDFDQFIYQTQLRKIYPLRPNDHAFYAWKYQMLPTILPILEAISVVVPTYLLRRKEVEVDSKSLLECVGAVFLGYILFFKGYSPQFTVFILPMVLVSLKGLKSVVLGVFLEVATELRGIICNALDCISRNIRIQMLEFTVLLRTITLAFAFIILFVKLYEGRVRKDA